MDRIVPQKVQTGAAWAARQAVKFIRQASASLAGDDTNVDANAQWVFFSPAFGALKSKAMAARAREPFKLGVICASLVACKVAPFDCEMCWHARVKPTSVGALCRSHAAAAAAAEAAATAAVERSCASERANEQTTILGARRRRQLTLIVGICSRRRSRRRRQRVYVSSHTRARARAQHRLIGDYEHRSLIACNDDGRRRRRVMSATRPHEHQSARAA